MRGIVIFLGMFMAFISASAQKGALRRQLSMGEQSPADKWGVNVNNNINNVVGGAGNTNINNNNNNVGSQGGININNNNNAVGGWGVHNNNNNVHVGTDGVAVNNNINNVLGGRRGNTDINNNNNNINGGGGGWGGVNVNNNINNVRGGSRGPRFAVDAVDPQGSNATEITAKEAHDRRKDVSTSIVVNNTGNGDGSGPLSGKNGPCSFNTRADGFEAPQSVTITSFTNNDEAGYTFYSVSRCEAEADHFCCDSGRRFSVCSVKDGKFLCQ